MRQGGSRMSQKDSLLRKSAKYSRASVTHRLINNIYGLINIIDFQYIMQKLIL